MPRSSPPPPEGSVSESPETGTEASGDAAPPLGGAPPAPRPPPRVPPPPPVPPPRAQKTDALPGARSGSVERVKAKETFAPDEPLPAFTFAAIDDAKKEELLRRVEEAARPQPQSSVDRVAAKKTFAPDEPLPAFTYPVLEEDKKLELLRRVEEAHAASAHSTEASPVPTIVAPSETAARPGEPFKTVSEPRKIGGDAPARAAAFVREWIDQACAAIDQGRSRLPLRVRAPLSRVPSGVLLAVLAALAFGIVVGGVLLIGEHSEKLPPKQAAPAPPPPKADPVPREIEQAKKDVSALEKLTERFPKDHRVWLELAAAHSEKGDLAAAVAAVGKALAADRKASEQSIAGDVLDQSIRKKDTTDASLELLEGPMGAAGATVLYDLAADPKVPLPLRTRAEEWIKSAAFEKVADPDLQMAAALRYAKSCVNRHDLLPRAGEKGGQRTLEYLKIVRVPGGCGHSARKDCFPCLRKDSALKDAIAAIEKRVGGK